jgi:predicted alpha/beta superfamily hydrolase
LAALLGGEELDVQTGGASLFLQSLRDEVMPFAEAHYRVSSTGRGLAGYSYGGLFTLCILFHARDMFTRHFAGSPVWWDPSFRYNECYASSDSDLKARLFMTMGGRELDKLEPVQRMVDRLRSRRYPGLKVLAHVFEGEGHRSAAVASISRALFALYDERWGHT